VKLTAEQAEAFFAHPSQRKGGKGGEVLPDEWEYRAQDGVCGVFHPSVIPGVWIGHILVKPEAWGNATNPARLILTDFAAETQALRIVGWVPECNRAMLALCRRLGFETDGRLPLPEPVVMVGWRP